MAGIADMLRTVLGSRIQLKIVADCLDCFVEADAAQFETSLVNMAVNARDAMEGEGKLTIVIASETDPSGAEAVCVSVIDTGQGIDPTQVDGIFEPFYTTKEVGKGTGLGLSQVYGFVKQSQGEVTVESKLGRGSTFKFSLPKVHADRVPKRTAERMSDEPPIGGRVLVVEDNDEVGLFASEMLSDLGFETVLEPDGLAALARLDLEHGRFDLVFSDVVMPGMDGVAFGETVRDRWPGIPVVLTSGYSHVLAQDPQHGFPLLQKPYSAEALSDILRQARQVERRPARPEKRMLRSPAPALVGSDAHWVGSGHRSLAYARSLPFGARGHTLSDRYWRIADVQASGSVFGRKRTVCFWLAEARRRTFSR